MLKFTVVLSLCMVAAYGGKSLRVVDVNDAAVIAAAKHGVQELSKQFRFKEHAKLYTIRKGTAYVVYDGEVYELTIIVGLTDCDKEPGVNYEDLDLGNCEFLDEHHGKSPYLQCRIKVFDETSHQDEHPYHHHLQGSSCNWLPKEKLPKV